jgi:PAS domain S-box-containing protein
MWGEALRRQEVIRSNGPFTVPRGHIPIERAIAAPIVFRGDTIGVLHVANKATDYDEKDTRLLEAIAGHVAPILHARLQSDRQREELRQHSDHLEETVQKRTADLRSANKKLLKEVNERKEAEQSLRESEDKYRRLVENLQEGIWATDKDARTTFVNSRMAAMIGYTCEEMLGRHIFAFMDEQGVEIARQGIERRRRGVAEQQDSVFLRKDGSRLCVTMAITPLVDANGQYAGGLAGMLDLTDRKAAAEALQESESRFRQVLKLSSDLIYRLDLESRTYDYVSPSVLRLSGFNEKEFAALGIRGVRHRVHPEDWPEFKRRLEKALQPRSDDGEARGHEYRWQCKDGQYRWFHESVAFVRGDDERLLAMVATVRDITERKQVEEALRESESRYRELFSGINSGVAVYEACSDGEDFVFRDFNQAGERIDSIQKDVLLGRRVTEVFPGIREFGLLDVFRRVWRTGAPEHHPVSIYRDNRIVGWRENYVYKLPSGEIVALYEDITQRKQAEEVLRQSEKRLASVYDTAGDVIFLLDVEKDGGYRFTSVNHAFLSVTGLPPEAVFGKRVNDVIPEPSLTLVLGKYRQAVQKKAIVRWEETSDYPAGRLTGEVSVVAVFDEGGNCTHLVGTVHDITERKRGEETLRESERRFRQVLDVSSDMIYKLDLESDTFDYTSPSVLEMTGFTREEFIAMGPCGLRRRIHPEDWPDFGRGSEEFVELGSHPCFEYRLQCKDGEYRWLSDNRSLVRGESGRPLALVGTVRDVTKRREAEEALRQSEEHFRELSASSPVGVFRSDAEGRAVYTNERLREITGLTLDQNLGLGWTDIVHPDDREAVLTEGSNAIASGQQYTLEFRLQTPHRGICWVRVHSRPILSTDGRQIGRVGTLEDITERRQAEERERRLHEQEARTRELRAAVRALERMAATLAHELRNPLGVISNSAYFLCNQAGISDARALKHAQIIGREVKSARRAIDDILEFALTPQILLSPASLNVIVDQALARSQIPANIRVTRKPAPDLPPLVCDAERLERAFLDIIANAVQAMPHGGRLSVRTQLAADGVTVVFSDTGEGIAPQNLAKVFDPMFTTKLRGIGLGLTVVRRTVDQHGGQVELKSKLARGTSVIVALPLASVDSASGNSVSAVAPGSAAQS